MTKLFWAVPVLMLAGCGSQGGNNTANESNAIEPATIIEPVNNVTNATNAVAPADTTAADEAAVRDAVTKVYASYSNPKAPETVLSKPFKAAWDRALSKDGVMDADPFCGCQDYDKFKATTKSVKIDGDHARVTVAISNFGQKRTMELGFLREGDVWHIDDIFDGFAKGMKAEMLAAKPGSWDAGAE